METYIQEEEIQIDATELELIREKIEAMNKFNQVEVLRILQYKNVTLNENKYGVHINLSELDNYTIDALKKYIEYVNNQEMDLNELEEKKATFKNTFFPSFSKTMNTKERCASASASEK